MISISCREIRVQFDACAVRLTRNFPRYAGPMSSNLQPQLISISEAAQLLGVSRRTVHNLLVAKELRSVKIRRRRLIPLGSILALARAGSAGEKVVS